ncbi:MAG: hypothetical protein H7X80_01480 [bacterium]|nr:hypothetical protein [Candidatus Kapabacteria bacterium]
MSHSAQAQMSTLASIDTVPARVLDLAAARRRLPLYMDAVAATLDHRLQNAIAKIPLSVRRYLAIRGYVRREYKVHTHWSWTASEASAFRKTAEYRAMVDSIVAIQKRFAFQNPGYRLEVVTDIRTLETQLSKWNKVASIAVSGREVIDTSLIVLADTSWSDVPDSAGTYRFRAFLHSYELNNTPTVAVPGFSDHGQLRAFDFKVYRHARLIAGTTTATIRRAWDLPGWSCKLNAAICNYSDVFVGPLIEPYEPWHYTWVGR